MVSVVRFIGTVFLVYKPYKQVTRKGMFVDVCWRIKKGSQVRFMYMIYHEML